MKKSEPRLKKITMNIPTKLYNEIIELAEENGLNFTSQCIYLLRNGIDQKIAVDYIPGIYDALINDKKLPKIKK